MMDLGMMLTNIDCGSFQVDSIIPAFTSTLVGAIKIFIPIVLIAFGMIDLAKAVMANDDKVMKEAQTKLVKRIVYAVVIFFVVAIVQLVFGMLAGADDVDGTEYKSNMTSCISCFVSGTDSKACKKVKG